MNLIFTNIIYFFLELISSNPKIGLMKPTTSKVKNGYMTIGAQTSELVQNMYIYFSYVFFLVLNKQNILFNSYQFNIFMD